MPPRKKKRRRWGRPYKFSGGPYKTFKVKIVIVDEEEKE